MMTVVVGGQKARLGPKQLLGQGGEACVYRWKNRAIKIYHSSSSPSFTRRFDKLRDFPKGLPARVLSPHSIVEDLQGRAVGFEMDLLGGVEDFRRLSQRKWRSGRLSHAEVVELFTSLHTLIGAVHDAGVVVGDLNEGNVVFDRAGPWLIDADSMQFAGHPCPVAHERFLAPELFGKDLAAECCFTPGTDWYAFCVLLFASLLYVHPFGGVHASHPTLMRRIEARHSLLRGDVCLPKSSLHYDLLPDELIQWFRDVFERDIRDVFPRRLLDLSFVQCAQCGFEHARRSCPECGRRGICSPRPSTMVHGRCRRISIQRGHIVAAAIQSGLVYLYEADGVLRREGGQSITPIASHEIDALHVGLAGRSTWLGRGDQLIELADGKALRRVSTDTCLGEPTFATNSGACVRVHDEWLTDVASGRRIGKVLEGQTRVWLGEQFGYGMYRAGNVTVHFLFDPHKGGTRRIELPSIRGHLLDIDVVFDASHVLVGWATEDHGRLRHALFLIGKDGLVRASRRGAPDDSPVLARVGGKALSGGRVIATTDRGLMTVPIDGPTKQLVEGDTFVDTEPFVTEGDDILPGPNGSVYVISQREIMQLTLG